MTLPEKFDQTLAKWIADAVMQSDMRWCIALAAADEVSDALGKGVYQKILIAKSAVDLIAAGMSIDDLNKKQHSIVDEALASLKTVEARLDNQRMDGKILHRSNTRQ